MRGNCSMKVLNIIHLGIGNVGKEVVRQISAQKNHIEKNLGVSLQYVNQFDSKHSEEEIKSAISSVSLPFVVIETTASDKTLPYIKQALQRGGFVVLANKKPLAVSQKDFDLLHQLGSNRLFYECVVGAGLPVIRPLKDFIETGDEIIEIQGCFSGTLGFLFSQLYAEKSFSESVLEAKQKGYTEPDPRDDLGGVDVARKALILARLLGKKIELSDIQLEGLYPAEMGSLTVDQFLTEIKTLDDLYNTKRKNAAEKNNVLRFVAKISPKECSVGLQEVEKTSDIGSLNGPDNIVVIKTKRYFDNPLVVKGPGAGIAVTAAGVFADVISAVKMI